MGDPEKVTLPEGAPKEAKEFFDCSSDKYTWPKGKVEWLTIKVDNPIGDGQIEVTPDVSFEHGKAAGSIDITVSLGYGISGTVNASVDKDGQLVANDVSLPLKPFKGKLDDAIKRINDWFKHNHKKLKPAVLRKGAVTLEKAPLTTAYAPPPEAPLATVPVALVSATPVTTEFDGPVAQVADAPTSTSAVPVLTAVAVGVAVLGLLAGYFVFGHNGPTPTLVANASATPSATATATPSTSATTTPTAALTPTSGASPTAGPTAAESSSPEARISLVCAEVHHQPIGNFVSYIHWAMVWQGYAVQSFALVISGTNDEKPNQLTYDPTTGEWQGDLGLHVPGDKTIEALVAMLPDGTPVELTDELIGLLGTDTLTVRYPQEDSFGTCPD